MIPDIVNVARCPADLHPGHLIVWNGKAQRVVKTAWRRHQHCFEVSLATAEGSEIALMPADIDVTCIYSVTYLPTTGDPQ